jgi:hypothetical protein
MGSIMLCHWNNVVSLILAGRWKAVKNKQRRKRERFNGNEKIMDR